MNLRKMGTIMFLLAGLTVSQMAGCGQRSVKADDKDGNNQGMIEESTDMPHTLEEENDSLRSEEVKENGEIVVTAALGEGGRK